MRLCHYEVFVKPSVCIYARACLHAGVCARAHAGVWCDIYDCVEQIPVVR